MADISEKIAKAEEEIRQLQHNSTSKKARKGKQGRISLLNGERYLRAFWNSRNSTETNR